MTSLLSYTLPNYALKNDPGSPRHIPQPFLNYGGLTNMLSNEKNPHIKTFPKKNQIKTKIKMVLQILYSKMSQKKKEKKPPKIPKKMKQ